MTPKKNHCYIPFFCLDFDLMNDVTDVGLFLNNYYWILPMTTKNCSSKN